MAAQALFGGDPLGHSRRMQGNSDIAAAPATAPSARCLDCATPLVGGYCHDCGQSAHVHRTLGSIGHDLLHGVFHFEGRIWRTLPLLVLHPGRLTRAYIDGQRTRYVSPLAAFLFSVFVLAAAFGWLGASDSAPARTPAERAAALQVTDRRIAGTEAELRALATRPPGDTAAVTARRFEQTSLAASLRSLQADRSALVSGRPRQDSGAFSHIDTGIAWVDEAMARIGANPGLFAYKMQAASYKFSWALIPLSTPFLALLFLWPRRFPLYDHAIFVTYSLAFMSLFAAADRLLLAIGMPGVIVGLLLLAVPPAHIFAQLRGTYAVGRFGAAWRTVLLVAFAGAALLLFGAVVGLMEVYD